MDPVSISWLVASAISPLVAVLALWTIYVFHTYRRRWRTVDLFLLTLATTELMSSLVTFCFAILNLVQRGPAFRLPCLAVRWGQVSSRTFQVAVLASMVVDRALTVRWPYRYRFSVRRNQIRYHIAVVAVVAALVGVAAVFAEVGDHKVPEELEPVGGGTGENIFGLPQDGTAIDGSMENTFGLPEDATSKPRLRTVRSSNDSSLQAASYSNRTSIANHRPRRSSNDGTNPLLPDYLSGRCNQHPAQWDVRFSVFLISLYTILLALWVFCTVQVEIHRSRPHVKLPPPECVSPDLPTGMNSPLDTQSSTGSTRALHRPSRQASRRPYGKDGKSTSDLRWPSVAFASLLCFFLNHVPYVVLMGLSTWHPRLWSPWHDPGLAWLGLLEGLVLPLLLFCRDAALGAALRRAFQRRSGALSPLVGDDGPFQMYFDKDHFRKRGTFGSVTPIGIITNYRRTPGGQQQQKSRSMRSKGGKYALPGLHGSDSVLPKKSASFLGGHAGEPLSKLSCADLTSLGMWREEEEEFYATMSDDFSTFSCKSGDDSALSEDLRDEDVYGGSFTTVANDDFEFHDTRPCGGEVRMKPALLSPDTPLPPPSRNTSFRENIRPKVPQVFPELPRPTTQLFVDLEEERKDPDLFAIPLADEEEKEPSTSTSPPDTPPQLPPTPKKPTSLSMNDLDLIHKRGPMDDLETTFILPVKSESTMSLYRLNTDQDVDSSLTPSRSETNVTNNGDSGFGSGAQSTNPVWSGFLCRKPSDPFWNMRKPSSSSVATTTTPTNKNNSPGVMHPRMRKIPWINAWKKLDENSRQQQQQTVANEQDGEEILGWKENLVYDANGALNSCAIDEELSDVSTPVAMQPSNFNNGDYNLNVFAQESGILMENAYGKIVRDDLGVQVNFYSKNDGVLKDPASCFQRNVEPTQLEKELFPSENHKSDYPNYRQSFGCDVSMSNPPLNNINKGFPNDNILCGIVGVRNDFKCEPRLNGGHYENLFGTKQNIFAQCDPLVERSKSKVADSGYHVDKRCGKDSCHLSAAKNNNFESVYGQLNKPEKFGFSKNVGRSPSKSKELRRRESDNRGNRVGIKRRESRTRSDPRPNLILETNACRSFAEFENKFGRIEKLGSDRPSVEIEMKNVNVKGELIHESRLPKLAVNRNPNSAKSKPDNNYNNKQNGGNVPPPTERVERRDSRGKDLKRTSVERKHSGRKAPTEHKDGCVLQQLERRVPQLSQRKESGLPVRVERRNSDRTTRNDPKAEKTTHENRIDRQGLWVNAIPFPGKEDEENGNSPPRKGSRQASRSPRKSNLPRRESSSNDNKARVRRKVSGNRARSEDPVGRVWGMRDPQKTKEDLPREDNIRDCERRLDQIVFCGKMNGNIDQQNGEVYPFETFQDNDARRQHLPTTRAALDDNENCRKLAITDFL